MDASAAGPTPLRCAGRSRRAGGCAAASLALLALLGLAPAAPLGAADTPQGSATGLQIVSALVANEAVAAQHKDRYTYISQERSDRTGGHLWTERVVETDAGKVTMLLAEDGRPLSPERTAQERARLAAIAADPAAFARRTQAARDDEAHAMRLLAFAPRAFLFGDPVPEGDLLRIAYRPNPAYQPQGIEERILHATSGTLLVDARTLRLHHIEGRLPQDVNIGFGLLATIRAGSSFATTRDCLGGAYWKTTSYDTDIDGRVIFFKSISRNEHVERSGFARVPNAITVAQAVAMAEER